MPWDENSTLHISPVLCYILHITIDVPILVGASKYRKGTLHSIVLIMFFIDVLIIVRP